MIGNKDITLVTNLYSLPAWKDCRSAVAFMISDCQLFPNQFPWYLSVDFDMGFWETRFCKTMCLNILVCEGMMRIVST